MAGTARCARHPARPAADRCPRCARPRCGADAADAPGGGCAVCRGGAAGQPTSEEEAQPRPAGGLERLVRATLAALAAGFAGGAVAGQYVDAGLFAYLAPFVVGVLCGASAQAAAGGPRRGLTARAVRAAAAAVAVPAVALGFVLEGSRGVLTSATVLPYLAALAGALLWTVPPRERRDGRND